MWIRYFALATAIVLAGLGALALLSHPRPDERSRAPYHASRPATGGGRDDAVRPSLPPVRGDAPWALSALPECFRQRAIVAGDAAFVRAKRPPGARRVPRGATLTAADCRLRVGTEDATVVRGENDLHVPAPARLYVAGPRLLLETVEGGRATARTYVLTDGRAPRFTRPTPRPVR